MIDEELRAELDRRAGNAHLPRDWARDELLPRVRSTIETRPQRVSAPRTPALAGLAGAAALVLILVVAMPALGPGRSSSPPVASVPDLSSVLTPQDFAALYEADQLNGSTVIVDGRIVRGDESAILYGEYCSRSAEVQADAAEFSCSLGVLAPLDRPLWVSAPYVATLAGEGSPLAEPAGWSWRAPQAPIEGRLVLSISEAGFIDYIGLAQNDPSKPMTVGDLAALDVERAHLRQVFLVRGWLIHRDYEDGATTTSASCFELYPSLPRLPYRHCLKYDRLTDEPLAAPGAPHIAVQEDAAALYRGSIDALPDVYALAPRLYGGGCTVEPPCRLWEVVGRLSETEGVSPRPPTTTETPPIDPSDSPRPAQAIDCSPIADSNSSRHATVVDASGLIESCEAVAPVFGELPLVNPDGDERVLQIQFQGSSCDAAASFRFSRRNTDYLMAGYRTSGVCRLDLVIHAIRFHLTEPVAAQDVTSFVGSGPAPTPSPQPHPTLTPVATPNVAPPPTEWVIECENPRAEIGAVVIDPTGLVAACVTVEGTGEGVAEEPVARNPDGDPSQLQIEWFGTPCGAAMGFTLIPGPSGISIETGPRPDGKIIGGEINGTDVCTLRPEIHAIRLTLTGEIDARNVFISQPGVPTTSLRSVTCDGTDVTVKDGTDLVVSCGYVAVADPPDGNPLITRPDGAPNTLRVIWQGQDPSACGPHPPQTALVLENARS